jgi:hypothetical protein
MILAAHVILSAYGFWLPSDPRGSWSDFVRAFDLLRFGDATKTDERNSLARSPHNSALRAAAKKEPCVWSSSASPARGERPYSPRRPGGSPG